MKLIQILINAIENYKPQTIIFKGQEVKVTGNLFNDDLWHIWVNGNVIHSTKRNRIKKILNEWLEGKRIFTTFGEAHTPLLIKNY
jgi:hypothetical protein